MFKRLAAYALSVLLACSAALATPPLVGNIIGKQAFHGPGSRGFLPTCSSKFSVTNILPNSNTFTSWTTNFSTGLAPTLTTSVADPTGGTGATSIVFPTVSGASHYSTIQQAISTTIMGNYYPYTFGLWAKVTAGGGNGSIWISESQGTTFVHASIPTDGNWHYVTATPSITPTSAFHFTAIGSTTIQIGVNLFDVGQPATTGSITVSVFDASIVGWPLAKYASYIATTSAAVTATQTIPCPAGVAFRDFAVAGPIPSHGLFPLTSNAIATQNTSEVYQAGGIGPPFPTSVIEVGGYYYGFANSTNVLNHSDWTSFSLYKSLNGIDGWVEDTANAPYLQVSGSNFAKPTINAAGSGYGASATGTLTWTGTGCPVNPVLAVTTTAGGATTTVSRTSGSCTTWPTTSSWTAGGGLSAGSGATFTWTSVRGTGTILFYELHAAWLPYGCNISGTAYPFCILYSAALNTTGEAAVYLAYSNTVDGAYTVYGGSSTPTAIIAHTGQSGAPGIGNPYLVSVVNYGGVNGVNYIYTAFNNSTPATAGLYTNVWTTPATGTGAGTSITFHNTALPLQVSGVDWDYGAQYLDNYVVTNGCGVYAYFYTAYVANVAGTSVSQVIGYAVSNSLEGPWWKWSSYIIPASSSLYNSTLFLGDSAVMLLNGRFIWLGNFDNGTNTSSAVAAVMQDACAY